MISEPLRFLAAGQIAILNGMDLGPLLELCEQGVRDGVFPGAAFAVGSAQKTEVGCVGRQRYEPSAPEITPATLFDMASVTKVFATTTAAMLLHDDGKLDIAAPVARYLPQFAVEGKKEITVRNLLVHDSGLPAYANYQGKLTTCEAVRQALLEEKPINPVGKTTVYSCLNAISLQRVIEALAGVPLDRFLSQRVFGPLGLTSTLFCPPEADWSLAAPTEKMARWRLSFRKEPPTQPEDIERALGAWIQGEVHDPLAYMQGGVSGNAGLFSTVGDTAKFLRMMLEKGSGSGKQIVCSGTVEEWTRRQGSESSRSLGWDTKSAKGSSAGSKFSMRSFGHTGFTGTCVWVDPENELFAVLLTNRVHPTSENSKTTQFRPKFHDLVFRLAKG